MSPSTYVTGTFCYCTSLHTYLTTSPRNGTLKDQTSRYQVTCIWNSVAEPVFPATLTLDFLDDGSPWTAISKPTKSVQGYESLIW